MNGCFSVLKDSEKHFTEECEQLLKEKESLEARVKTTSMHCCLSSVHYCEHITAVFCLLVHSGVIVILYYYVFLADVGRVSASR